MSLLQFVADEFHGVGADGIPGEIVGVEPAPARARERDLRGRERETSLLPPRTHTRGRDGEVELADEPSPAAVPVVMPVNGIAHRLASPKAEVIKVRGAPTRPAILWVVGGPGSNKAQLCQKAVAQRQGWTHFSLGQRLRALADSGGGPASDGALSRAAVGGGELVAAELVARLVRSATGDAVRSGHGLVLDGYPRDLEQLDAFQKEVASCQILKT
ncbi:unnamed protein product, partial [Iphiclides podalirius]